MDTAENEKLIIAKLDDKIRNCKTKNKIVNTEFLNLYQKQIIQKRLNELKIKSYIFDGGFKEAESKILILYPEKLEKEIVTQNLDNIINAIKIELPNELNGKYKHGDYLSTLMRLGLLRERIGDIIVYENEAYIVVLKENAEYIKNSLREFTKFKKAKIDIIKLEDINSKKPEMQEISVHTNSMRLDNIVSEIAKCSRSRADELIKNEKVSINCKYEYKSSKQVNIGDVVIIRGSGKYIINSARENQKNNRLIINLSKYI